MRWMGSLIPVSCDSTCNDKRGGGGRKGGREQEDELWSLPHERGRFYEHLPSSIWDHPPHSAVACSVCVASHPLAATVHGCRDCRKITLDLGVGAPLGLSGRG